MAPASSDDGGIKAQWIREGSPAVYRDWSLSGGAITAYAAIAAQPRIQGGIRHWFRS